MTKETAAIAEDLRAISEEYGADTTITIAAEIIAPFLQYLNWAEMIAALNNELSKISKQRKK